jgi:hypothetical protein
MWATELLVVGRAQGVRRRAVGVGGTWNAGVVRHFAEGASDFRVFLAKCGTNQQNSNTELELRWSNEPWKSFGFEAVGGWS